jgi:hypothetical protein
VGRVDGVLVGWIREGAVRRAACSLCDAVELGSPRMRREVATPAQIDMEKYNPKN